MTNTIERFELTLGNQGVALTFPINYYFVTLIEGCY